MVQSRLSFKSHPFSARIKGGKSGGDICVDPSIKVHPNIKWQRRNGRFWEPFIKRLFQRNYYEHIIRNVKSLNRIHHYILTNPENWEKEIENPKTNYEKGKVVNPKDSLLESYYQSIIEKD